MLKSTHYDIIFGLMPLIPMLKEGVNHSFNFAKVDVTLKQTRLEMKL
jgi:hypothetical protein